MYIYVHVYIYICIYAYIHIVIFIFLAGLEAAEGRQIYIVYSVESLRYIVYYIPICICIHIYIYVYILFISSRSSRRYKV